MRSAARLRRPFPEAAVCFVLACTRRLRAQSERAHASTRLAPLVAGRRILKARLRTPSAGQLLTLVHAPRAVASMHAWAPAAASHTRTLQPAGRRARPRSVRARLCNSHPALSLRRAQAMTRARRPWGACPIQSAAVLAACLLVALPGMRRAAAQTTPTLTLSTAQPSGNTNTSTVVATALLTNAGAPVADQPIAFSTVGTTGARPLAPGGRGAAPRTCLQGSCSLAARGVGNIKPLRRAVASLAGRSGCQGRAPTRAERRSRAGSCTAGHARPADPGSAAAAASRASWRSAPCRASRRRMRSCAPQPLLPRAGLRLYVLLLACWCLASAIYQGTQRQIRRAPGLPMVGAATFLASFIHCSPAIGFSKKQARLCCRQKQ